MSSKGFVVGGKLKFKGGGDSKTVNKVAKSVEVSSSGESSKARKRTIEESADTDSKPSDAHLTEAQRRFKRRQQEKEEKKIKVEASKSFRDRVEEFNYKLSKLTEHNDIPRVSAAGNG
ncbi:hypothetical protein EON65_52345 [archaeon]|nr:MAG: hypothetical protein EON65_52345 [archaeon]